MSDELPRLPVQLWECVLRTAYFITQVPSLIRGRSLRPVGGGAHFLQLPEAEKREERIKEWDGRGRPPGTLLPVRVFGGRSPLTPPYASFRFPSLSIGRAEASVPPGRSALSGAFFGFMNLGENADHQPTRSQGTPRDSEEEQVPCVAEESSKKRRLHTGVHDHSEEAELGAEEGSSGTSDERL